MATNIADLFEHVVDVVPERPALIAGDVRLTYEELEAGRQPVVDAAVEMQQRIAGFSQPGTELTKKSLHAGVAASSLADYITSEGIGQLYLRLLTDNFEEATRARQEGRSPDFRDGHPPG